MHVHAVADFKTKDMNFELETKAGNQMEDPGLAKATIVKNHRKLCDYEKETVEKMLDDAKANGGHIASRPQEPRSEKLGTAGLVRKITFGTTKDKKIAIEDCTNIKARPRIKSTEVRPSIKQNEV